MAKTEEINKLSPLRKDVQKLASQVAAVETRLAKTATKKELKALETATQREFRTLRKEMATKTELKALRKEIATKKELRELRKEMATKAELRALRKEMATKAELGAVKDRLMRLEFQLGVTKESFDQKLDRKFKEYTKIVLDRLNDLLGRIKTQQEEMILMREQIDRIKEHVGMV